MQLDLDAKLTASQAALAVGVSKQTFNHWRKAGRIQPDQHGRYRFGDALQLEAQMRRAPQSSRGVGQRRALAAA